MANSEKNYMLKLALSIYKEFLHVVVLTLLIFREIYRITPRFRCAFFDQKALTISDE